MSKLKWNLFKIGLIGSLLILSVGIAGAFSVNVKPMTEDTVLRVLYYGGLKGNIAPCG